MSSEDDSSKFEKFKQHLKDNKKVYLVGGGCLIAGYFLRRPRVITIVKETAPTIAPVFNNMPVFNNDNSSMVNFGGHITKMVKRLSDGKLWETVTEAATEEGFDLSRFSRHLNGHTEHLNGEIYAIIGIGTTS